MKKDDVQNPRKDYSYRELNSHSRMPDNPWEGRFWRICKGLWYSSWIRFLVCIIFIVLLNVIKIKDVNLVWYSLIPGAYILYLWWKSIYSKSRYDAGEKSYTYLRRSTQVILCPECKKDGMVFVGKDKDDRGTGGYSIYTSGSNVSVGAGFSPTHFANYKCPRCGHEESFQIDYGFKVLKYRKNVLELKRRERENKEKEYEKYGRHKQRDEKRAREQEIKDNEKQVKQQLKLSKTQQITTEEEKTAKQLERERAIDEANKIIANVAKDYKAQPTTSKKTTSKK